MPLWWGAAIRPEEILPWGGVAVRSKEYRCEGARPQGWRNIAMRGLRNIAARGHGHKAKGILCEGHLAQRSLNMASTQQSTGFEPRKLQPCTSTGRECYNNAGQHTSWLPRTEKPQQHSCRAEFMMNNTVAPLRWKKGEVSIRLVYLSKLPYGTGFKNRLMCANVTAEILWGGFFCVRYKKICYCTARRPRWLDFERKNN